VCEGNRATRGMLLVGKQGNTGCAGATRVCAGATRGGNTGVCWGNRATRGVRWQQGNKGVGNWQLGCARETRAFKGVGLGCPFCPSFFAVTKTLCTIPKLIPNILIHFRIRLPSNTNTPPPRGRPLSPSWAYYLLRVTDLGRDVVELRCEFKKFLHTTVDVRGVGRSVSEKVEVNWGSKHPLSLSWISLVSALSQSWLSLGSVLAQPCLCLGSVLALSWRCLVSALAQPRLSLVSATLSLSQLCLCLGSASSQSRLCFGFVLSHPLFCLGSILAQPCLGLISVLYLPFLSLVSVLSVTFLPTSALATTSLACAPTPASLHSTPGRILSHNTF
jgi:hypothetical protein